MHQERDTHHQRTPGQKIFCFALAEIYKKGADTNGGDCKLVHLIDLKFNPVLTYGYQIVSALEPDVKHMQQDILHADCFRLYFGANLCCVAV